MATESPRLTPAVINDLTNQLDAAETLVERLTRYAAGLPHAENPAELTQRELHGYLVATTALLRTLSERVEQLGEGVE